MEKSKEKNEKFFLRNEIELNGKNTKLNIKVKEWRVR